MGRLGAPALRLRLWAVVLCLETCAAVSVRLDHDAYTGYVGQNLTITCHFSPPTADANVMAALQHVGDQNTTSLRLSDLKADVGVATFFSPAIRLSDAGAYHCVVVAGRSADYKSLNVRVYAHYDRINASGSLALGQAVAVCTAIGYPLASVSWGNVTENVTTTTNTTAEGLFQVTSTARWSASEGSDNVTCVFWNPGIQEDTSATFTLIEEVAATSRLLAVLPLSISIPCTAVIALYLWLQHRKLPRRDPPTETGPDASPPLLNAIQLLVRQRESSAAALRV